MIRLRITALKFPCDLLSVRLCACEIFSTYGCYVFRLDKFTRAKNSISKRRKDRGRHCKITKLMSSQTGAFGLPRHVKFEIYTLHKIRKSKRCQMIYYRHLFKFSNKSINFDSKGFCFNQMPNTWLNFKTETPMWVYSSYPASKSGWCQALFLDLSDC